MRAVRSNRSRSGVAAVLAVAACGTPAGRAGSPHHAAAASADPDGPHRAAVAAQVQPYVDGEVVSAVVIGLYEAGKLEIYGFGRGPGGARPTGTTLFALGPPSKIYTSIVLADAVLRRELELDAPITDLLPPGVTAPTSEGASITLRELALHSAGLPRLPWSVASRAADPDPFAGYGEDQLYGDLVQARLDAAPGKQIEYSEFGAGLLGFALGRKLGGGYARVLHERVLEPLRLHDTYLTVPADAQARVVAGTNSDLAVVRPWSWGSLASAGALVTTARDQLALIEAEIEAATGSKSPLRPALRLTQEAQLDHEGGNESLGWEIDSRGRYWHHGGTAGYRSFIGFDPKTRRGVVMLAATSDEVLDHLFDALWKVLEAREVPAPPVLPTADQLAPFVGHYDVAGSKIDVVQRQRRLYIEGGGIKVRLVPFSDHEFWVEELQSVAVFERIDGKVARISFRVHGTALSATRVE
jgi:CubicO group peptidase (beta-lactamase class C family)